MENDLKLSNLIQIDNIMKLEQSNENNELIVVFYTRSTDISGLETKGGIDVVMLKYSSDGNLMWQRQFGGTDYDVFGGIKFLEDGSKLRITVRFRGRELNNVQIGEAVLNKFEEELSDIANTEKKPHLEGKNMFLILAKK